MKSNKWIIFLTIIFLITTYEHLYFSLQMFNHQLVFLGIPWSTIANVIMVAGIDLSIFFGVRSIPGRREENASILPIVSIIMLMTVISVLLNVRYMITVPELIFGFNFDTIVGIVVGVVIPVTIIVFAWDEGQRSRKTIQKEKKEKKREEEILDPKYERINKQLKQKFGTNVIDIQKYKETYPEKSQRQIATELNVSQSKVSRALNGGNDDESMQDEAI